MQENKKSFTEFQKILNSFTDISEEEIKKYRNPFSLNELKNLDDNKNDGLTKQIPKDIDIMEKHGLKIFDIEDTSLEDTGGLNDYEDLFIDPIEKLNKNSKYPISEYQAFQIANENQNLKTDYYRNSDKKITYLDFTNCNVKLVTKSKKKYWHIKITDGKVSWIEFNEKNTDEFTEPIFCDGFLIKKDFKKLQCLIDVNTGEYIYYSK